MRPASYTAGTDWSRREYVRPAVSAGRLEQFDRIPVRILDLDLAAPGTGFHLVAKMKSRLLQFSDKGWKIGDFQHDAIPPAGLLLLSVRHWPRARCAGTAEQNLCVTKHDVRERGELLVFEREPEVLRVERARASHIRHLIANAVNRLDECMWRGLAGCVSASLTTASFSRRTASSILIRTALRRRQMPQLVRIAHHVQRPNHVALNLERRRLHRSLGCVHDDAGQAVDGRKAQREVVAPPRTWAFARDVNQEPRRAIGAVDHVQRRPHLAAAVRHDAHVAREQLRQGIEIARLGCRQRMRT